MVCTTWAAQHSRQEVKKKHYNCHLTQFWKTKNEWKLWDRNTRQLFILRTLDLDWAFEQVGTTAGLSLQRTLFTPGPSELCPLERRAGQGIGAKGSLDMSCPQACP